MSRPAVLAWVLSVCSALRRSQAKTLAELVAAAALTERVSLAKGQSRMVTFRLGSRNLGFYNNDGRFVLEPGPFDVWVGDSSVGGLHGSFAMR